MRFNKILASLVLGTALAGGIKVEAEPIASWNFNEGSGSVVYDSTGNNNIGYLEGGISWTEAGHSGSALYFDGLSGRINIPKTESMDLTEQVSLEAWINRDGTQNGTIFSRNGPFYLGVQDNRLFAGVTCGHSEGWTFVQGTTQLEVGQWYNVAMSYDGTNLRGYVNGVQEDIQPRTGEMVVRSQQPYIGWGEPGQDQYFKGTIDDVKVHPSVIPEPSSTGLLGLIALGGFALRRFKRNSR